MPTASSPGKLILAGEHAILHGAPALALAVEPRVICTVEPSPDNRLHLQLPGRTPWSINADQLDSLRQDTESRHRRFLDGALPAVDVVESPEALLALAASRTGSNRIWRLTYASDLPVGSGMGASAAFLLSTLRALAPEWSPEDRYQAALDLEHYQHGTSSGLDVWTSLHGGTWWIDGTARTRLPVHALPGFALYHSGAPASTTGECVARVREWHAGDTALWSRFREVAEKMKDALESGASDGWSDAIRANHALLCHIGVVPGTVQQAIEIFEAHGGAAKICGAGSVSGNAAGVVLTREVPPELIPPSWVRIDARYSPDGIR